MEREYFTLGKYAGGFRSQVKHPCSGGRLFNEGQHSLIPLTLASAFLLAFLRPNLDEFTAQKALWIFLSIVFPPFFFGHGCFIGRHQVFPSMLTMFLRSGHALQAEEEVVQQCALCCYSYDGSTAIWERLIDIPTQCKEEKTTKKIVHRPVHSQWTLVHFKRRLLGSHLYIRVLWVFFLGEDAKI